ncbi:MAG: hypothetical protein JWN25_928 [Verrucomicrobiales bacterium]|nr:hypothetical protein [Verrucomicrobiales bacterium]
MVTKSQIIPLLLTFCPSFHNVWGELQRRDEDQFIYIAFGAFTGHLQRLAMRRKSSDLLLVNRLLVKLQKEGDQETRMLALELSQSLRSVLHDCID